MQPSVLPAPTQATLDALDWSRTDPFLECPYRDTLALVEELCRLGVDLTHASIWKGYDNYHVRLDYVVVFTPLHGPRLHRFTVRREFSRTRANFRGFDNATDTAQQVARSLAAGMR
jgi:hypothetical protein